MSYYPDYNRPPQGSPYQQPPYDGGYQQPPPPAPYDNRPPYERSPYSAPPPGARPPPNPPPPAPPGWHQEWEPSTRRAFWVEEATGRSQWESPFPSAAPAGPPSGYYDGSRSVPPPEPAGGYYAPPPGPPPMEYGDRGYGGGYEQHEEKKSSNAGKYLAAGAAGLALGGIAGAVIEHEVSKYHHTLKSFAFRLRSMTEQFYFPCFIYLTNSIDSEDSSDREEQEEREAELRREAYEDGREDQAEFDEEYY